MSNGRFLRALLILLSTVAYIGSIIYIGIESVRSDNCKWQTDEDGAFVLEDGKKVCEVNAAGEEVPADPPPIPSDITALLAVVGAALAVHTGAVLGIEMQEPGGEGSQQRVKLRQARSFWFGVLTVDDTKGRTTLREAWNKIIGFLTGQIPDLAAVIYVLGLLIAAGFYFIGESFSEAAVPFLRSSWLVLIGIFAGVWSAGGPNTRPVPDLVGDGSVIKARASEMLTGHGLKPKWEPKDEDTEDNWVVMGQDPEKYRPVVPGTEITVTLKKPE